MRQASLAAATFLFALGCALPTWGQQSTPPTDLQVEQARAQAAEAQSAYLIQYARKQQAEFAAQHQAEQKKAEDTAAYWAEYVKGLSPNHAARDGGPTK